MRNNGVLRMILNMRMLLLTLGLVGMGISGYMTYVEVRGVHPLCLPGTDCLTVLASPYAHILGVPVALLGLLMYSLLTVLGLLLLGRTSAKHEMIVPAVFTVSLAGTLYSAYLLTLSFSKYMPSVAGAWSRDW